MNHKKQTLRPDRRKKTCQAESVNCFFFLYISFGCKLTWKEKKKRYRYQQRLDGMLNEVYMNICMHVNGISKN